MDTEVCLCKDENSLKCFYLLLDEISFKFIGEGCFIMVEESLNIVYESL